MVAEVPKEMFFAANPTERRALMRVRR